MKQLRAIWRSMGLAAVAACTWLALQGTALAAGGPVDNEALTKDPGGSKYVASYSVVLLGIGLGLLFVCNSSRRRDRAKTEQYGE